MIRRNFLILLLCACCIGGEPLFGANSNFSEMYQQEGELDDFPFENGSVCAVNTPQSCDNEGDWDPDVSCCSNLVWVPEAAPLFRPFVADPRQLTFSVGWRFNDRLFNRNTAPVSFDNHFAFFRYYNPFGKLGVLQFEIEAGVWALFEHTTHAASLDNADYYVGLPLIFWQGPWKYRLRLWHASSHLGDEFMVLNPDIRRRNPSLEAIDFFISYEPSWHFRIYGGAGIILRNDPDFNCKRIFAEYGMEVRIGQWNTFYKRSQMWGRPYGGVHFRSREDCNFKLDATFVLGYEWTKICGLQRRIRIFGEYHTGCSVEGQFCHLTTDYYAIRVSYGY